jgi:2-dehydropantoate 2-reductase
MQDPTLIVGTGAMACLFAARIAAAGNKVTLLGSWAEGLQNLNSFGVRLVDEDGTERAFPVRAIADPSEFVDVRLALVLVKSWQTERAARQLRECLSPDGLALTLQNGLGNQEALEAALGASRVALGVTTAGATLLEPGKARTGGHGIISLGAHQRIGPAVNLLQGAGFEVQVVARALDLLWSKLIINAAINPLTALLRVPNGELLNRPSACALMASVANEAAAVAASRGQILTYSDPVVASRTVAQRTAANHSSMLQDVQRGAPTEIDAICGAIVKAGEIEGVSTPINRTLWLLIKAQYEDGGAL